MSRRTTLPSRPKSPNALFDEIGGTKPGTFVAITRTQRASQRLRVDIGAFR